MSPTPRAPDTGPVASDAPSDRTTTYAHGSRVLVRLDAGSLRPAPWSERLRDAGRALVRPAH
ncbi:hypothetical protein QFZ82_006453 [Streptomyces sp. V4I23]|nr:hypothetical protein [Streptomyces sp. V4I23]